MPYVAFRPAFRDHLLTLTPARMERVAAPVASVTVLAALRHSKVGPSGGFCDSSSIRVPGSSGPLYCTMLESASVFSLIAIDFGVSEKIFGDVHSTVSGEEVLPHVLGHEAFNLMYQHGKSKRSHAQVI